MDSLYQGLDTADIAGWQAFDAPAQLPSGNRRPRRATLGEAAAPDIPEAVGRMILASYAMMMAGLILLFGSVEALFMVGISTLYTTIYLAVPTLFLTVEGRSGGRTMSDFLDRGLDSWTGPMGGREALLQILLIPAAIILSILIIGTAAAIIL